MKQELNYTIKKIEESTLNTFPYCYLEIDNIFSNGFYQDLISCKPQDFKSYRPLSKMYSDRYVMELGYGENANKKLASVYLSDSRKQLFWREFQKTFIENKDLAHSFIEKYKNFLNVDRAKKGKINCRLSCDLKGYSIGVHRDKRDKVLSVLFYIPDSYQDDRANNWGTQILTPRGKIVHTDSHHPYNVDGTHDTFDLYKTVQYGPNKLFSWCVGERSYHGVAPTVFEGKRESIAFFIKQK